MRRRVDSGGEKRQGELGEIRKEEKTYGTDSMAHGLPMRPLPQETSFDCAPLLADAILLSGLQRGLPTSIGRAHPSEDGPPIRHDWRSSKTRGLMIRYRRGQIHIPNDDSIEQAFANVTAVIHQLSEEFLP